MGKKDDDRYYNGFDMDYLMTRLVQESDDFFYPKPLKCMKINTKKKKSE